MSWTSPLGESIQSAGPKKLFELLSEVMGIELL